MSKTVVTTTAIVPALAVDASAATGVEPARLLHNPAANRP